MFSAHTHTICTCVYLVCMEGKEPQSLPIFFTLRKYVAGHLGKKGRAVKQIWGQQIHDPVFKSATTTMSNAADRETSAAVFP